MKKKKDLSYVDNIINLDCPSETLFLNYYRLTDCLRKLEFEASKSNCLILLNNNPKVLKLIKHIIDNNIEDVVAGNFTNFTKDIILINLMIAYCDSTNIKIANKRINIKQINSPVLALKEEKKLFELYQNGLNEARDIIILRNLNLVRHFAHKYATKYDIKEIDTINDLISCGTIGLYDAINSFDLNRGKFSTFAAGRIIHEICSYLKYQNFVITKPKAYVDKKIYITKKTNELTIILGRKPSNEEIADYVGMTLEALENFYAQELQTTEPFVLIKDEKQSIWDYIESDDKIDQDLIDNEIIELFDKCKLTSYQRKCLMLYCFYDMSFQEIGNIYGVTRQSVHNVIKAALVKIKKSTCGKQYIEQFNLTRNGNIS